MLGHVKQRQAAKSFSKTWEGRGYDFIFTTMIYIIIFYWSRLTFWS